MSDQPGLIRAEGCRIRTECEGTRMRDHAHHSAGYDSQREILTLLASRFNKASARPMGVA
jgi:hypothetical protein